MFGPHSKPISAVLVSFGRRTIRSDSINMTRIWPNRCKSKPSRHESQKKKKKKKIRHSTNARAVVSVAAPRVGLWCGTLPAALVLPSCSLVDHINGLPGKASPLENWLYCYYFLILTLLILDQICVLLSS